jgi:hypothetical protein
MAMPMTIPAKRNGTAPPPAIAAITPGEIMEQVLIKGDLKNLSEGERARYYTRVCESVGLNPLTKPFEYITLNGKLTLYARKDATDQLRTLHNVSVIETTQEEMEGVYIIVCKVQNGAGRTDIARGAVTLTGLKGEALANAIMKTETKAKRRATLSICGLGFLDETEVEDLTPEPKRKTSAGAKRDGTNDTFNEIRRQIASAPECETLAQIADSYAQELANLPVRWSLMVSQEFEDKWQDLGGSLEDSPVRAGDEPG